MRKIIFLLLFSVMCFSACSNHTGNNVQSENEGQEALTTTPEAEPVYDTLQVIRMELYRYELSAEPSGDRYKDGYTPRYNLLLSNDLIVPNVKLTNFFVKEEDWLVIRDNRVLVKNLRERR